MARANAQYYAAHDPFQDFTTAPEVSQAFGEVLGAWAAVTWQAMGCPNPVILVELGPGRGTLIRDALRAIGRVAPAFRAALAVHLVETSTRLRAAQRQAAPDATWHDRLGDVPDGPLIVLANEFLDALPIRQFVRRGTGWAERWVVAGTFEERPAEGFSDARAPEAAEGNVLEVGDAAAGLCAELARRVRNSGGAALLIDYGPLRSAPGDSLQALRAARAADPLKDPGSADLTAHVDFQAVAHTATEAGAACYGPVPQGVFLVRLGLVQRAFTLARQLPPAKGAAVIEAARRLVEPTAMGSLFKVLAVCHPALPCPPGFEDP